MPVPQISVVELEAALAAGAHLYDVREPSEYRIAHVEGAVLIPLGEVVDSIDKFDSVAAVYLICASGARSDRAAQYLRSRGIDAHNVAGGTNAWIKSGRKVHGDHNEANQS